MKELNNFRKFIAEGQLNENVSPKALMKVYQDEIENVKQNEQEDEIPAYEAGIEMLKQGVHPEKVNDEVGNMLVQITGEYGDPTVFMDLARKLSEEQIHEGTWALGSVAEMVKVLGKLEQIRKMGAAKGSIELENLDTILYNVFGDDSFSDAIDAAKGTDDDDRFNNFMGDAQTRALELYRDEVRDAKEQGETGFEFKPRFGLEEDVEDALPGEEGYDSDALALKGIGLGHAKLEENDAILDEIIGEEKEEVKEIDLAGSVEALPDVAAVASFLAGALGVPAAALASMSLGELKKLIQGTRMEENKKEVNEATVFDRIDQMMDTIADQMSPDDAFKALAAEFQVVSGGTMMLERALRRMIEDLGLTGDVREEEVEEIRSAYNESLDEGLTQDILKNHPKKYKDEKAVKAAAAKLMKSPKFKGKGIGPVLQALLKGKE